MGLVPRMIGLCVWRVMFGEGVGDTCFEVCKGYIEKVVPFLYALDIRVSAVSQLVAS
jgi:hypothetical protein